MLILGIESSCDETAAALVRDGHQVLSSFISSSVKLHSAYGGVIPELAAREHLKNIEPVIAGVLEQGGATLDDVDAIAVTSHPGLIPALLVGNAFAKGIAASRGIPIMGINHTEGHIFGAFIDHQELLVKEKFPLLCLVVSGGHTTLILVEGNGRAKLVGTTLDDAAGEALDKAAKVLDLGYPGGPIIDRLAKSGNSKAYDFPRGLTGGNGKPVPAEHKYDFSFSGVKTALLYAVKDRTLSEQELCDAVASYQAAVMDVLVTKAMTAANDFGARMICLCGGVACNSYLRENLQTKAEAKGLQVVLAPPKYCTDNAAMIGGLGYYHFLAGQRDGLDMPVSPRLPADLGVFPFAPSALA